MPIYLHELVDIVPGRGADYADSMAEHYESSPARRSDGMLGLFSAVETVGEWPLGVNVWQYGSWDDVASQLRRQFEPQAQDPALKQWWLANLHLRTGGRDRLLESTSYTSDVAGLGARGVQGALFLHQIVRFGPGGTEPYLKAFGEEGVPAAESAGAQLVGAYRVLLRDHEAVLILAFRDGADFARFQSAWYDPATSLGRWREREEEWVRGKDSWLLRPRYFPGRGQVLHRASPNPTPPTPDARCKT